MPVPAPKVDSYLAELVAESPPSEIRLHALIREMKQELRKASRRQELAALHTGLGIAYALLNNEGTAFEHHRAACGLVTDNFAIPNNYGVTLDRFDRTDEALQWYFVAAEAANGYNAEVLGNLAVALARLGEADEARRIFEEAFRLAQTPSDVGHVARKAAKLGYHEAAISLAARHAALTCDRRLAGLAPLAAIDAAPAAWRDQFFRPHEMALAWAVVKRSDALRPIMARLPPTPDSVKVESPIDDDVFVWTREFRERATRAEAPRTGDV